jgi:hypothetical protein
VSRLRIVFLKEIAQLLGWAISFDLSTISIASGVKLLLLRCVSRSIQPLPALCLGAGLSVGSSGRSSGSR